jgi:membrane peptidoglycan carboxypeptidase
MNDVGGINVFGGTFPALVWHNFMVQAMDGLPNDDFIPPTFTRGGKYLQAPKGTESGRPRTPTSGTSATSSSSTASGSTSSSSSGSGGATTTTPDTTPGTTPPTHPPETVPTTIPNAGGP